MDGPPVSAQPSDHDRHGFERLLNAAHSGDREALGKLLERARPKMLRVIRRKIDKAWMSKTGGSDIVQDACLKAYTCLAQFHGGSEPDFERWLLLILGCCLKDTAKAYRTGMRSSRREHAIDSDDRTLEVIRQFVDPSADAGAPVRRSEESGQVRGAIAELPPGLRQVLVWHAQEDRTFVEIGRRLGCSSSAVFKRWLVASATLRRKLGSLRM
jgi:RNA polymerase sigma-70 factor, ECF subfamily